MHRLKMPHAAARVGIQAHERLGEEVVALSMSAVVVVAGCADGEIQQTAPLVHGERRPHVRMSGVRRGSVLPRLVAELTFLWDEIELPYELARTNVKRLHHSGRILPIDEAVPHAVADDHEVLVHDRR